jgi:SAM-dependent methyltransferase
MLHNLTVVKYNPTSMKKIKKSDAVTRLNLACGQVKEDGWIGVDIAKTDKADIVFDIMTYPWTFAEDESVDEIFCSHYIEHIPQEFIVHNGKKKDALVAFMDECWRILKPGGKMQFIAPYWSSMRSAQDPTHRRPICEASFLYYNQEWLKMNGLDHYNIEANFEYNYAYNIDGVISTKNEETKAYMVKHYTNSVNDVIVNLTKLPI